MRSFLCKIGIHSWVYVRWPWFPYADLPQGQFWRGCRWCHLGQKETHDWSDTSFIGTHFVEFDPECYGYRRAA